MSKYTKLLEKIANYKNNSKFKEKTREALLWYNQKIKSLTSDKEPIFTEKELKQKTKNSKKISSGLFYIFGYEPINKNTLPYYDAFPIVLVLKVLDKGFIGLNMHYLDPYYRATFMENLYIYEKPDPYLLSTRINISYDALISSDKLKFYKPCIKRYHTSKIRKFIVKVPVEEWDIFLFMPTEDFRKQNKDKIWKTSRDLIANKGK